MEMKKTVAYKIRIHSVFKYISKEFFYITEDIFIFQALRRSPRFFENLGYKVVLDSNA